MKKLLSLLLVAAMLICCMPGPINVNAAENSQKLYLKPNSNWLEANARFAIYHWNAEGDAWTDMADTDNDGIYEGEIPAGYTNLIFCRMNPGTTANNWDNKWNQTGDLTVPTDDSNCYAVADGTWDQGGGAWSVYTPEEEDPTEETTEDPTEESTEAPAETAAYYVAGTAELCGEAWACDAEANKMTLNSEGLYEKTYEAVPAGTYEFKVTDGTWDNSWGNNGSNYVLDITEEADVTITFNADTKEIDVILAGESGEDPTEDPTVEAAYYVAGSGSLCGSNWNNSDPANKMTLNADGLYEKTYEAVPAGTYEFKVTDGTWDNCWGDNGNNYVFTTTEAKNVTITFDAESKEIQVILSDVDPYFVAGTAELCGNAWACGDEANKMDLNADGLYEKTYENVPAGTHEFKVTDGTWDNCWGNNGSNYSFTTTEVKNVTITFNADTKEISVTLSDASSDDSEPEETEPEETTPTEPVEEELYIVAGTGSLCGSEWNPADETNKMSLNAEGLYEKYFVNVPAGTHQFKVTDGSWSNSWGKDGGSDNYEFTTTEVKNIKITFNAETKEITVTEILIDPYYVAGTDTLCGVGWDPGYEANKMYLDADGLYKKLFESVPAGTHECKVTAGDWGTNWGVGGANGANYTFTTDDTYNVTITFNPETLEIGHTLAEATEPSEPLEPVVYPITVKVHYYRADGNYSGWEVHMWNGSGITTESATRPFVLEDVVYDGTTYGATATYGTNSSETWVGFIVKTPSWTKDPDGDRHIDISDVLSGTVHVYAKSGSALEDFVVDKDGCVLGAKITGAKWDSMTGILTVTTSMAVEGDLMEAFTLEGPDGEIEITSVTRDESAQGYVYILGYPENAISKDQAYKIYYNDASCDVTIPNIYSTEEFEAAYTYTGDDLGAIWSAESTTFRVWAPTAAKVFVNLYESGTQGADDLIESVEMTADVNGTWIATVEGDLNGTYYTYSVNIQGKISEAVDPYARTTGVNGNRGMVVDLDATDPTGWEDDDYVTQDNYTDAVIWELHVRDFSIDESSGMTNKGKYLAFTELGTTVPGTDISTGVDYMVNLGVNYVHLLPVYDINSVDETTGGYNWGYDPKNYNVPEGSYSTDPYNGAVRVTEFKQMVQSLHDNGIGVIMDVVYNHVADAGTFCFNQIVPGYFSRIHDDGSYQSNSGCGNDTASERSMVRKYIVDSVLYWAEEYHIDGFRWDLVGLIDYETINAVMEEVHKVNPNIIFYGEGWEMCGWTTKDEGTYASDPYSKKMTIQPNDQKVNTEAGVFAFFNDTIRNVIHGGVFTATDKGFVSGNMSADTKQTVTMGYMGNSNWGSDSASVDTPLQTINYASCHDNYTLFDNLTIDVMDATGADAAGAAAKAAEMNNLAAAYYITAQGVPFIHAGEEMLRSKPDSAQENGFNHNSYASGDAINSFKWGNLQNELNADTYAYYQGLIAFRKAHPALRMTTEAEIQASVSVLDTGNVNVIAILNKGGNGEAAEILTIINADSKTNTVTLPEGRWNVYVNKDEAGTEILETVEGTVQVESTSAMILVKAISGIVEENGVLYYYVDGVKTYAGLICIDGEYYYVRSNCQLVVNRTYWITKHNDLLPEGNYKFDEAGKLIQKNGIVEENGGLYYYVDNVKTYAGLMEIDGAYYYVRSNGQLVVNRTYWVTKHNGYLPAGNYEFGADGKMIVKEGVVLDADGEIRYYVDGVATYAGLVQDGEGNYYYINSSKVAIKNRSYWVTKTNGLLPAGNYTFGEDGKMINPPVE